MFQVAVAIISFLVFAESRILPENRSVCSEDEFQCQFLLCIPLSWKCDGDIDCPGGEDEGKSCKLMDTTCTASQFKCNIGRCIHTSWKCDGEVDCVDGSDEENCPNRDKHCPGNDFQCDDKCIPRRKVCDAIGDCIDGTDESYCIVNATRSSVPPITNSTTETGLLPTTGIFCLNSQFACEDGTTCVFSSWQCDGDNDCGDGSDERNCEQCDQFQCNNMQCIPKAWKCDSDRDCDDGSDEKDCKYVNSCPKDHFKCAYGSCRPSRWRCDGIDDCGDNSDEIDCH